MTQSIEKLSASSIAGGAVIESLDYEVQRALDNIIDPNTPAKGARTVTLTIKIMPEEGRDEAKITFVAKSTLQPAAAVETRLFIHDQKGVAVASEYVKPEPQKQAALPANVSKIAAAGGSEE